MSELKRHRKNKKEKVQTSAGRKLGILCRCFLLYCCSHCCFSPSVCLFSDCSKTGKGKAQGSGSIRRAFPLPKNRLLSLIQPPETLFSTNRFWNLPFIWIPRTGPMITHPFSPTAKISCQRPIIPLSPLKVLL